MWIMVYFNHHSSNWNLYYLTKQILFVLIYIIQQNVLKPVLLIPTFQLFFPFSLSFFLCQKERLTGNIQLCPWWKSDLSFNMLCHMALLSEKIFHPRFLTALVLFFWRFPWECAEFLTNVAWVINWVSAIGNELDVKWKQKRHSRSLLNILL